MQIYSISNRYVVHKWRQFNVLNMLNTIFIYIYVTANCPKEHYEFNKNNNLHIQLYNIVHYLQQKIKYSYGAANFYFPKRRNFP